MECAAYARQSVEKKNSLSIEGQIDLCQKAAGRELKVYEDKGYSGKNTERPAFQKLIQDIKNRKISRLYVYRLDRFSRSVADFGNLWEILQAQLDELDRRADRLLDARKREQNRPLLPDKLDFAVLSFEDKKLVAAQFIRRIDIFQDHADIIWNV